MKKFSSNKYKNGFSFIITIILILLIILSNAEGERFNRSDEENFVLVCPKNIFINVNLNDAKAAIKIWGEALQKQLKMGVRFDLQLFDNVQEIVNSPDRDNFGLIMLNSIDYLNLKSKMHLYPILVATDKDNIYMQFLLLVKGKQYKNLKDLKSKKLGLLKTSYYPVSKMWLEVLLNKNKQKKEEEFFSSIKEYDSESQLVMSVFFGQNDACIVPKAAFETMKELNPQVGEQLNVLSESPDYLKGLSCFTENSRKFSYSERFIEASLNLGSYSSGKQIMTLLKTENAVRFKAEYLESSQELLKDYNNLFIKGTVK